MVAMVPAERASVAAAEKLVRGPVSDKKCKKKAPRKVHKAEREKHKRDQLNDLFGELGTTPEADRQNNGKACILTDTTRILRDLQNEHYVTMERNELQDENNVLRNEILELQNELAIRLADNQGWGHGTVGSPLPVPHSANSVFPTQQPMQPPSVASAVSPLQQPQQQPTVIEHSYTAPPRELKLFPDVASADGLEPPEDQEAPNHVA